MQGIYLRDWKRPRTKSEIKSEILLGENVRLEATSMLASEYDGGLDNAPDGEYNFVGPCPFTNRRFTGTITKRDGKVTVK